MGYVKKTLELLAFGCLTIASLPLLSARQSCASAQGTQRAASVGQLYFYLIKDRPSFEEGYRHHLGWHASHNDELVWYAWTVDSGIHKGDFVDGTFGATFAGLDSRPDLADDGADFVRNVTPYVTALDTETWTLWALPSTATPLENRRPETTIDVFLLEVAPAEIQRFESAVERLARSKRDGTNLSWYRIVRGSNTPTYALLLSRKSWADLETAGPTLSKMLIKCYASSPTQVAEALSHVRSFRAETWSYEPRLSLIPGRPLEP